MKSLNPKLLIEINKNEFIFVVIKNENENENIQNIDKIIIPLNGFNSNKISDYDIVFQILKKNIYLLEQKLNYIFNEVVLIIENFDCKLINFSGFKKLNSSQLSKENISYIINSLKSNINEVEKKKTILHIFNSRFTLDKKDLENLPIGLFGNFYCHELAFFLIDDNDFKILQEIFSKCNLRIKKILSKNFIESVNILESNTTLKNFLKLSINKKNTEIFFIENSSLKFIQSFEFGTDIILNDISKVTGINKKNVELILKETNFSIDNIKNEILENNFFKDQNFRKIKKKLIIDIAIARIEELLEKLVINNINLSYFLNYETTIFINIFDTNIYNCFGNSFKYSLERDNHFKTKLINNSFSEKIYFNADKVVQFGWKKEAVPIIQEKKSIISRFFDQIFK